MPANQTLSGMWITPRSMNMKYKNLETLADRARFWRKKRRLTQAGLAELVGVQPDNIAKVERGISKNPRFLPKLAEALGISAAELQFGESAADSSPLNEHILQRILETVEEEFERTGLSLPPDKKARLILNLYRIHTETGSTPSDDLISGLIRMMA